MNNRPTIGIITQSQSVFNTFLQQMEGYFGNLVEITGYSLEQEEPTTLVCDLCIVSHNGIEDLANNLIGKKVFVARRTLNPARLKPVFELPKGSSVLVVNNFKESVEETVVLLKELGVDHLKLIPYFPGSHVDLEGIKVALTPGMVSLVPTQFKHVIDMGNRIIDLSTLIEMSVYSNLSMEKAHFMSARLTGEIIKLNLEQTNLVEKLKQTNKQMEIILNNIGDGVIAVDQNQKIVVSNSIAKSLVGFPLDSDINGYLVKDLIPSLELDEIIVTGLPQINKLYEINNVQILVTETPLIQEGQVKGIVLILREVSNLTKASYDLSAEMQKKGYIGKYHFSDIIADSEVMKRAVDLAKQIALTDLPALIFGESGTGKELFAHAIHNHSIRKLGPFIAVNLAALPETLVDSELFGYEQGAFTGAKKTGKPGFFEQAHKGTIFLDEIGEISQGIQVKLLRVLEQKEVMRIGATKIFPVDVRIITATNKNLKKMVREGTFRSDLYFRLCIVPLHISPLRERKRDIVVLTKHFFYKYLGKELELPRALIIELENYDWPGNARELEGMVRFSAQLGQRNVQDMFEFLLQLIKNSLEDSPQKSNFQLDDLLVRGSSKEFYFVLDEFRKAKINGTRIGRNSLVANAIKKGIKISEQQIRARIEYLQEIGCVQSGLGRQGTYITGKGEQLLEIILKEENRVQ